MTTAAETTNANTLAPNIAANRTKGNVGTTFFATLPSGPSIDAGDRVLTDGGEWATVTRIERHGDTYENSWVRFELAVNASICWTVQVPASTGAIRKAR